MAQQIADKRRVYLACRAIFTGDKALLRRAKKVREEVEKRQYALGSLTQDLGVEKVVEIARDLLERRVFESELKAKVEFPELFLSSLDQEVQREASEIDAARSTAEALEEIASAEHIDPESDDDFRFNFKEEGKNETNAEPITIRHTVILPSLYPTYIPYKTQHLILNEAQRMLEASCFEFAQKWLPSFLEERGWECASSVELTRWTRVLAKQADKIPEEALNLGGASMTEILFATSKLRHSAVHRIATTARGIQDLVKSAVALACALKDHKRASQLEEMCYELESKIKAMELNKNALESSAAASLEEIQRQREELDKKEKEVIANMTKRDGENRGFVGALIEDSVVRILEEKVEVEDGVKTVDREEDGGSDIYV
ncbi:hypothetical protein F5Y04DRAFT_264163 [Hypomontagnella monticulosa]|nr:hypothetical protein F5Y04DRAFT_264163 [Hypomontagnella monticulosa]